MIPRSPMHATAEAAEDAFYDALERGDLEAVLAVWSDDDDSVCVHPGRARLVGLDAIRESFAALLRSGGMRARPTGRRTYRGTGLAVHHVIEEVTVSGRHGTEIVRVLAVNVYAETPSGWQMVMHHATPATDEEDEAAAPAGGTLH